METTLLRVQPYFLGAFGSAWLEEGIRRSLSCAVMNIVLL